MNEQAQNFANHTKYDPQFHFFMLPVAALNIIAVGYHLFRHPSVHLAWLLILSFVLLVIVARMRSYATHLQDRIIRLEERLRLGTVLPEPLRSRIGELSEGQLIGLRFASDAELPALVQRTLDEKLDRAAIKKAITNWRPDNSRI